MSYSIIYQNKFIEIDNNNVLMALRVGCNNDDEGRKPNRYNYFKLFTKAELLTEAEKYLSAPEDESWNVKVGSKYMNDHGYGKWLLNGLKKAMSLYAFKENYIFSAFFYKGYEDYEINGETYRRILTETLDSIYDVAQNIDKSIEAFIKLKR